MLKTHFANPICSAARRKVEPPSDGVIVKINLDTNPKTTQLQPGAPRGLRGFARRDRGFLPTSGRAVLRSNSFNRVPPGFSFRRSFPGQTFDYLIFSYKDLENNSLLFPTEPGAQNRNIINGGREGSLKTHPPPFAPVTASPFPVFRISEQEMGRKKGGPLRAPRRKPRYLDGRRYDVERN